MDVQVSYKGNHMIYTLTLNTAIDMNIYCNDLKPNSVNRTSYTEYSPKW